MAADAYEKLDLNEAARNVYNQVVVFLRKPNGENEPGPFGSFVKILNKSSLTNSLLLFS